MIFPEEEGRAVVQAPKNPSTSGTPLAQFVTKAIWYFGQQTREFCYYLPNLT